MKGFRRLMAAFCLPAVLLSGCGRTAVPRTVEEPTLVISEDGSVTAYLVGKFDKSYYDPDELTAMARAEAEDFGESAVGAAPVTVESVQVSQDGSGRVVVTYAFGSTTSYEGFIGDRLFYGTPAEAIESGYGIGVTLQSVKGAAPLTREDLLQQAKRHLVITDAAVSVYCPEKVEYLSEGAVLNEDGSVDTSQADGLVYILLKK